MEVRSGAGGGVPPAVLPGLPPAAGACRPRLPVVGTGIPPSGVLAAPPADEETEHALEWALVREGALVLPPWTFQITPQFSYSHWDKVQEPLV